jgi:hypothetical protein
MAAAPTVMAALRAFLPGYLRRHAPLLNPHQQRALWAIQACRTPVLGGHVHACAQCSKRHFAYHSCNHKACPQCGREATAEWVAREQTKLIGAPYFMVTFTLPEELRGLFFGSGTKAAFDAFFTAASQALSEKLAAPRWLGAASNGFTMVLHTWNQQMGFHPHLHAIVPGGGLAARGDLARVKNENFLLPVPVLSKAFRARFREQMRQNGWQCDPSVWRKDWGVHIQPFGDGQNAVKYLGAYVARSVIADARIVAITASEVTFRYKDRAQGNAPRTLTLTGIEFIRRYLRHVLPRGLRAIRYYGFCHPSAKKTRLKVTLLSGRPVQLGAGTQTSAPERRPAHCPGCGAPMQHAGKIEADWRWRVLFNARGPPMQIVRVHQAA